MNITTINISFNFHYIPQWFNLGQIVLEYLCQLVLGFLHVWILGILVEPYPLHKLHSSVQRKGTIGRLVLNRENQTRGGVWINHFLLPC